LCALPLQDRDIRFNDCPNQRVIHGWVLVRQLISEIHNSPRASDRCERSRRDAGERGDGLADDNESRSTDERTKRVD
jgi:hypothetical protein